MGCKAPLSSEAMVLVQLHTAHVAEMPLSATEKSDGSHQKLSEGDEGQTAVLSLSGEIRTQTEVCRQQLEMIVQANPEYTFDVFHVSDAQSDESCVTATRAEPNVRRVTVVTIPQSDIQETCSHHGRLCPPLLKQRICRDTIIKNSADKADIFIHTRFDLKFMSPLVFGNMQVGSHFYVFRNPPKDVSGADIHNQKAQPFVWNGGYSLANTCPDYGFVGNWNHVSAALGRVELAWSLEAGNTTATCYSKQYAGHCQDSPEEFLLETLRREGIWFPGTPKVQLQFAEPVVQIFRR